MSERVRYALDLHRKNSECLGFLPQQRVEEYDERGQLWLAYENDDPAGYLLFGHGHPTLRIYQACVQYDARRREHGLGLVARLIRHATAKGYEAIALRCRENLDANAFWREAGFTLCGQVLGGRRRGRMLNRWVFFLPSPQMRLPLGGVDDPTA